MTNISAPSDVSTSGTRVEAINAGGTTSAVNVTVNGVAFTGSSTLLSLNNDSDFYNGNTGDTNYNTLLSSLDYGNGTDLVSLTVGGGLLISGNPYQIQVWYADTGQTRTTPVGDGLGNKVNLAGNPGSYAIGTFTADGSSQTLTLESPNFSNAHITAYQIRALSAEPPPTPTVPTNLTATAGNAQITLDWDNNNQSGFANFIVRRSTTPGGPYTNVSGATPAVSNYTDTGLTNGTTYYYVVAAVNTVPQTSADSIEASATPVVIVPPSAPPNFVFIITDDQDTYSIGAYRNSEAVEPGANGTPYIVDTPNMDRLATEGMLFHDARIMGSWTGAVCTASRTCIMTGLNTWTAQKGGTAANTFPGVFNRGVRTGSSTLPYATYRTCKSGNSYPTANNEFTIVNDATKRGNTDTFGSEWHGDRAIEHIEHWRTNHRPNGKPFLMYLGFSHPHDTRSARTDPNLTGRYGCINTTTPASLITNPASPPLPFNHLSCTPATYPAHPFDHGNLTVRDENTASGILQYRTEPVVRNEIGRNFACVDWIDRQLGKVFARLEDPNNDGNKSDSVIDNTYIVFTTDHGIAIGRHGLQGKQNLYEHTWRVPFIVRGPGIAAGSHSDALVYLHDTFPTFCDLAGLDLPPTIDANDGKSFKAVLQGASSTHRDHLYGLYSGGDKPGIRSVTDGRFKLIKYDVGSNATQVTQMFDIETNPFELLPEHGVPNIASLPAYASLRQQLEEALMQQRILNADPYAYLGDRTLLRFEDGTAGQPASTLLDRLPFTNNGTAYSGTGGALPVFSSTVPGPKDFVTGDSNTLSLDLEKDLQQYVQIPHKDRAISFGDAPFTIEAWVKLESLPTGNNLTSTMPVVMKKVIGAADADIDYMFLAAAGNYGGATNFNRLALMLGGSTIVSSLAIPDTGWHHISVALNPVTDTIRFTLDEQVDIQTTTLTGIANIGPVIVGAHFDSSSQVDRAFDGLIDELSITDGFLPLSDLQPLSAVTTVDTFKILDFQIAAGGSSLSLTFESDDTHLYTVQKSTTMLPDSWVDVMTFVPGTTGTTQTTVADIPVESSTTKEFYRVSTSK